METEFVIWFTLRPLRQAPCSKELCSFSYPKTDYEQSLNTQHVDPRLRVDLVDNCPKPQPPPLMCWGLNLHHTSPLFPPSILPPNLPLFFPSSFLPSQQAGGTNTAEKRPLHSCTSTGTSFWGENGGREDTGEGLCCGGVDTTREGGQRVGGWIGGGVIVALASISRSGGGHAYL